MPPDSNDFDAIVIGTGFAGAVTACRLVQAGRRICVLERGRRYGPNDFPTYPTNDLFVQDDREDYAPPPDFSRWLWRADSGIYDIRNLGDALVVQAAGYGGGSLIYANVHLRPPKDVFDRGWPDEYREGLLTPYFDLVAYMLDVTVMPQRLAKTAQMERAAKKLGYDGNWFRTPLAVNFGQVQGNNGVQGKNRYGRNQQVCDMRGKCWLGCDTKAKNTLDLNYLAIVEKPPRDGRPLADIRLLAEVCSIECVPMERGQMFSVGYLDHLIRSEQGNARVGDEGARRTVSAPHVFLCAGSVNTTELLLKSRERLGRLCESKALGSHYHPNADSFSVVFDCDEAHEADYGPTITSALLYRRSADHDATPSLDFKEGQLVKDLSEEPVRGDCVVGAHSGARAVLSHDPWLDWGQWTSKDATGVLVLGSVEKNFNQGEELAIKSGSDGAHKATAVARSRVTWHQDWFLAEDGGYPSDLEPLLGVFRSPLWLRRNRYLETDERGMKPRPPLRSPRAPLRNLSRRQRLRVKTFTDAIGGTARRVTSPTGVLATSYDQSRLQTASAARGDAAGPVGKWNGLEADLWGLLPEWLRSALEKDREDLLAQVTAMAEPLIEGLLDQAAEAMAEQVDLDVLSMMAGVGRGAVDEDRDGAKKRVLIRGMLGIGMQLIWGSEAGLASQSASMILGYLPKNPRELLERLGDLLLWAIAYRVSEGNTGMILTMGRDLHRGALYLNGDQLKARLPGPLLSSDVTQERILRAIAKDGWHGELRTNPAWAFLQKRVTVHSQGGCPTGKDPVDSVTDQWGEVHTCRGLYVMDAAAFPMPVGVNPSASIAAIAEFKIEHFIQNELSDDLQRWTAPEMSKAKIWADRCRSDLDPLGKVSNSSQPPKREPIGLAFEEAMRGFFAYRVKNAPSYWERLDSFSRCTPEFEEAEDEGITLGQSLRTDLKVTVTDLSQLIRRGRENSSIEIPVTGKVTLKGCHGETEFGIDNRSFLQLFVKPDKEGKFRTRFFRYELRLRNGDMVHALKVVRDDPRFDLWTDTATLYFDLVSPATPCARRGILRLSLRDFLEKQVRSINVTGTEDPARKSWAIAAFLEYFLGQLAKVYIPEAGELVEALKETVRRTHV